MGTAIITSLVIVKETDPGVFTTTAIGIEGEATTTTQFEIRASGTYDLTTPGEPQLTKGTYVPPLSVPEPSGLLQVLAGLAALAGIQQHRRCRRAPRPEGSGTRRSPRSAAQGRPAGS